MVRPVLFLSGAGLPAWIWDEVGARLDGTGQVVPPAPAGSTLSDHVDLALSVVEGWGPCTVVAHSIGGVVATGLVARAPERVGAVVAVAACIPAPGQSFLGTLPFPQRHVLSAVMRVAGTRPPAREIRQGLCRGVSGEIADRIVADFRPESARLYRDEVPPRRFPGDSVYVLTAQDTQFTGSQQARYAMALGGGRQMIDTGHLPMLQDPAGLARLITDRR